MRSQLIYCSPIWRPHLLKDIILLESVQRRATKYLLNDYRSDYKSRLVALGLLPLMYILELNDLMFCIKSLIAPTRDFDLSRHIQFCKGPTRSSASLKMVHIRSSSNSTRHSFFNRLPRLWNCLPPIDLALSPATIKKHASIHLLI